MHKKFSVRLVTYCAMLIAVEIVLNRFCSYNSTFQKIGFSFIPIIITANLLGPVCAAVVYGLADLIGALLFPIGPYHPGFTLCAAAMGLVYGIFLYKKPGSGRRIRFFPHMIVPVLINNLIFSLLINTGWIAMLYSSKSYAGYFLSRVPEAVMQIAASMILIPTLLKLSDQLRKVLENHNKNKEKVL